MVRKCLVVIVMALCCFGQGHAENGYDLWLRYDRIADVSLAKQYRAGLQQLVVAGTSPTYTAARQELKMALDKMLQWQLPESNAPTLPGALIIGTGQSSLIGGLPLSKDLAAIGTEGFLIRSVQVNNKPAIVIAANTEIGALYGVFHFLQLMQTQQPLTRLAITEQPKIKLRVLNHWDNLNGTIERGYAGYSIWDWQRLPGYIDKKYVDYARANASVGINGTVLNNVNANVKSLTKEYLVKAAALANTFRPYGIKVYLTAKFSAPKELGGLKTTDPLDPAVIRWWKDKTDEVYKYIPDFGGYLVKANSEGQPGPQDYKRTHADGANMLAAALKPHGGIVMWRTFVYENRKGEDRAKQAYEEFKKFDGQFADNVLIQPKNGPIDFQPREALHPLLGAMPGTPQMLEFQITQEYLGFATHLVYLAPLFKETLDADTYSQGKGSTVAKIVEGTLEHHALSGIAGVANIGSDGNWCGHPFAQANWYAFGRMAWNPDLTSAGVANDWLKMTFSNDKRFIDPVQQFMLASREAAVDYMMPLGLNHIMNLGSHYGPGPWDKITGWDAYVYHLADSVGLGVDRSATGSNAVEQYFQPVRDQLNDLKTCPDKYLLWFHHVSWDYVMPSGRTMWNELVHHYYAGVEAVEKMQVTWAALKGKIDEERFEQVQKLLVVQAKESAWWRDGCVLYFQTYSKRPLPAGCKMPEHPLSYYKSIPFPDF